MRRLPFLGVELLLYFCGAVGGSPACCFRIFQLRLADAESHNIASVGVGADFFVMDIDAILNHFSNFQRVIFVAFIILCPLAYALLFLYWPFFRTLDLLPSLMFTAACAIFMDAGGVVFAIGTMPKGVPSSLMPISYVVAPAIFIVGGFFIGRAYHLMTGFCWFFVGLSVAPLFLRKPSTPKEEATEGRLEENEVSQNTE